LCGGDQWAKIEIVETPPNTKGVHALSKASQHTFLDGFVDDKAGAS